ncbi:MAG TPA: hypothetical protein VGM82_21180 [Gemmatimonadaceae bacterium]
MGASGILGRVDNVLNTYREEYGLADRDVNVVFGAHGNGLGEPFGLAELAEGRRREIRRRREV